MTAPAITPADPDELACQLADEKASERLIARLEASGHTVQRNRSGGFLVSRWGMSRHCLDLDSLRDFAKQVRVI